MMHIVQPPKPQPGDKVAVLSPSFAAPAVAPAIHEQALRRFAELTELVPVEFPTTRKLGASPDERAADFNAALADPEIRAVISTIGGYDQITVVPHLDASLLRSDPKPFLGYSDNTNILNWMWTNGVTGFYGGSTQVHFGPGPHVDPEHFASLTAALLTGENLEVTEPGESEDYGKDWDDPAALFEFGERGTLAAVAGAVVARPTTSALGSSHPEAVICAGPPFGHTRPQWILPYGGEVTLNGNEQRLLASYH